MAGKQKGYLYSLHKFYSYQTFDHILFGYVLGATRVLPTLSINKAIEMFLNDFNLCEDEYCFEAARATYYRIMKSLREKEEGAIDCYEIPPQK
jgi:hypothetical protein